AFRAGGRTALPYLGMHGAGVPCGNIGRRRHRRMRLNVSGGSGGEFRETMRAAEVIGLPVVNVRPRGSGGIDVHATDRILHAGEPSRKEGSLPASEELAGISAWFWQWLPRVQADHRVAL